MENISEGESTDSGEMRTTEDFLLTCTLKLGGAGKKRWRWLVVAIEPWKGKLQHNTEAGKENYRILFQEDFFSSEELQEMSS